MCTSHLCMRLFFPVITEKKLDTDSGFISGSMRRCVWSDGRARETSLEKRKQQNGGGEAISFSYNNNYNSSFDNSCLKLNISLSNSYLFCKISHQHVVVVLQSILLVFQPSVHNIHCTCMLILFMTCLLIDWDDIFNEDRNKLLTIVHINLQL